MPVPKVVRKEHEKRKDPQLYRESHKPAVPGYKGKDQKGSSERYRERKTAETLFQRRVQGELEESDDGKPAYNRENLYFSAQVLFLR